MAEYSAMDIANWFIERDNKAVEDRGEKLTLLKLLKLLYYAEGCYLAIKGESLFDEKIIAWEHGPVVVEVYNEFPNAYNLAETSNKNIRFKKIAKDDEEILENVFDVFGDFSAWGLRNKTHREKPWIEATDNGAHLNREISRETMKNYFKENYIE